MLTWLERWGIVQILPRRDLFFESRPIPPGVRLSSELIRINYAKLSPVPHPRIISYRFGDRLYLWFVQVEKVHARIAIPEDFLLFLGTGRQDGVYHIVETPSWVFVVQGGELRASFLLRDAMGLAVTMEEYGVTETHRIEKGEVEALLLRGKKALKTADLLQFAEWEVSRERLFSEMVERWTYPLLGLLAFYALVTFFQGEKMRSEVEALKKEYGVLRQQNAPFKQKVREHNRRVRFLKEFASTELEGIDPMRLLYDLTSVVPSDESSRVRAFRIGGNEIRISIETERDPVVYLNRLDHLPYLQNVVLRNTRNLGRSKKKIYTFLMEPAR